MICNDLFQSHPECNGIIRKVISSASYKCLIAIDGLDEWKISDEAKSILKIEGLPNIENMANCTFLWSMRPWVMEKFSDIIRANDRVVEIQGLNTDSINVVIENMLINFYELEKGSYKYEAKLQEIIEKSQDPKLKSLMQIPLMAVACIQVWYEEKEVGASMTNLYATLLDLLVKRANQKSPLPTHIKEKILKENNEITNMPFVVTQNKRIKENASMIMKLGKIAYDDLISGETRLVFRVEDLENYLKDYELEYALNTGLLSKYEAPGSCNEENVSMNFFHKSIQEFLAAVYIESREEISAFHRQLPSIDAIMELSNVLVFLSGLNPVLGSSISKHIANVADHDTYICKYRAFNDIMFLNQKVDLLYKLQASCYREMLFSFASKDIRSNLPYHVSDVYLPYGSDNEIRRTTADILTHHHADIRSLRLWYVPTDSESGIPDSILTHFLDNAKSLEAFCINGNNNRTLCKINDRFSLLTSLVLFQVSLTCEDINALQLALQSNKVIQTLGLVHIKCCSFNDCEPVSMSGLIQILPDIRSLSTLRIAVSQNADKHVLQTVLSRLSHLHCIEYYHALPEDIKYDRCIVQALSSWTTLRRLCLFRVDLGDGGLQLSHNMVHIEIVILYSVSMSSASWIRFIQSTVNVKHAFDVELFDLDIDEDCMKFILSSHHLRRIRQGAKEDSCRFRFNRIWPLKSAKHSFESDNQ